MFRKTLIKLTALNTVIFITLIALLGAAVYFYTQNQLNLSVNHSLVEAENSVINRQKPFPHMDAGRVETVVWGPGAKVIGTSRGVMLSNADLKKMYPGQYGTLVDYKINQTYYRTLSIKAETPHGLSTIEFFKDTTIERLLLQKLLVILFSGCLIGTFFALAGGYYLARRALNPIQKSWEKQQQFVSDASHEIRTPLAIIQTKIELLLKKPEAKIKDSLKEISVTLKETRRLSRLVSNLLTLARSDSDRIEIQRKPILMNEMLKQVAEYFEEMAEYQEKSLILNLSSDRLFILGDEERIHQLMVILLDNAMKFTEPGDKIVVSGWLESHTAHIRIKDTGIGIEKADMPKIFDRFFQSDVSRTDREGSGLGLSLAQWVVEKHRGKIHVESEKGKGTSFEVRFPLAKEKITGSGADFGV